ncbi:MAG: hypothetical protein Q9209_003469 [Squamulea sp. 1 TL-2023]
MGLVLTDGASADRSSTGITYQKLYAPEVPHLARFQHVDIHGDKEVWRFYRTVGDQRELPVRPSYAIMTACYQAALFRIIHESLNLYCGLRGLATAEKVLNTYRRYIDWEHDLPSIVKSIETGSFDGTNLQELRRLIVQHAQKGAEVLEHYRRLYSTRYLMPLLSFCIVHLGDALIRYSPEDPPASSTVEFSLGLLQQASIGFPICGPLQELYRRTAIECGTKLPANVDEIASPLGSYGVDDILDACTRLDYKQPVDQSVRHIDENIAADWASKWQEIVNSPDRPQPPLSTRKSSNSTSSSSGSDQHMRIASLLNV